LRYKQVLYLLVLSGFFCGVCAGAKKLGDISDGSRAESVHKINLYDSEGNKITAGDEPAMAFSTKQTCGVCHDYDTIKTGWHFNAVDSNVPAGRSGQPWMVVDPASATVIPVSYRDWAGTFRPDQIGLTSWQFTKLFAKHMPGGGAGEIESDEPDEIMRSFVSGDLETNCLACHNKSPGQDQAEYAAQVSKENYRWAPAGACEFASVTGSAKDMPDTYDPIMPGVLEDAKKRPAIKYGACAFDEKNRVLFDITREVADKRCYFCHSTAAVEGDEVAEKWHGNEDVHLTSGLKCVDCHRNGLGHNIVRGYEGESCESTNTLAAASSCAGCHLGEGTEQIGRLGAPVPKHAGIPAVHFEKIACTACHSGQMPGMTTARVKTSQAHSLGVHNSNKSADALPHIISPVFSKQSDGKIAASNLIWPAYWGGLAGGAVKPIKLNIVKSIIPDVIKSSAAAREGDWPAVTEEQISDALTLLVTLEMVEGEPVYISGGRMYRLDKDKLVSQEHTAASAYIWPIGHNVRPAAQSLGVGGCEDCHSTDAGFLFGQVEVDTPVVSQQGSSVGMTEFAELGSTYTKLFAMSFVFRPMMKVVTLGSCGLIAVVLLVYGLKALGCIGRVLVGKD